MRKNVVNIGFVASVMLALMLFVGPLAAPALAGGEQGVGLGFHFVSLSVDPDGPEDGGSEPGHGLFMTGTGKFNHQHVTGGGFFNHFDNGTGMLLATGEWRAKRMISFTPVDSPSIPIPFGFVVVGVLEAEVLLFPEGGPPNGVPAILKVVCNLPGAMTGFPEGFFLDVEGLSFGPIGPVPVGITAFSVGQKRGP